MAQTTITIVIDHNAHDDADFDDAVEKILRRGVDLTGGNKRDADARQGLVDVLTLIPTDAVTVTTEYPPRG